MNSLSGRYQTRLLEVLDEETDGKRVKERLLEEFANTALGPYVESLSVEMLAVAIELLKKWGIRSSERAVFTGDNRIYDSSPE